MASALKRMQEKLKELEAGRGKATFWTVPVGQNRIRVLPPRKGKKGGVFYKEYDQHFRLGPERNAAIVCAGKKCPACRLVEKLSDSSSPKKQKRAEAMIAKTQYAMNIVVVESPSAFNKKQVLVWSTTSNNLQELLGIQTDADYGDFTDVKRGFVIKVKRKGLKMKTRYKISSEPKPSRFKLWKKVKKKMIDLDKRFAPPTTKKVKEIMKNGWQQASDD